MIYEEKDVLRLAKRVQNVRRSYLLVNPLQGKHIPVSPSVSLRMMESLGERLRRAFPGTKLVIGFAETATAIGAAAAGCFDEDCVYIHTTRECPEKARTWIHFQEEHSHATDQKLCVDRLREWISTTPQIILVDDELSTGKTVLNMVAQLRGMFPELERKRFVAASIINRLSDENIRRLLENNIVCEPLLKIPEVDYTQTVQRFRADSPTDRRGALCAQANVEIQRIDFGGTDLRLGASVGQYRAACRSVIHRAMPPIKQHLSQGKRVLVLGTEEFMHLPLLLARELEQSGLLKETVFHAVTRSPIGICREPGYPIFNGCQISSFYEAERATYIYDLAPCDLAIVLSDSTNDSRAAVRDLAAALSENGCREVLFLCGGANV